MHITPTVYLIAAATPWLIVLGKYDWKTRTLPNRLTLGGSAVVVAWLFGWGGVPYLLNGLLGGFIAGALLLIPFLGVWYIVFLTQFLIYDPLNRELHIEEQFSVVSNGSHSENHIFL